MTSVKEILKDETIKYPEDRVSRIALFLLDNVFRKDECKLSQAERYIIFIDAFVVEVNNGGFHQFFENWPGDYCQEVMNGLKSIGAEETLSLLNQAILVVFDSHVFIPKDQQERRELLDIPGEKFDQLDEIAEDFYKENIHKLMFNYINENIDQFSH